jgi:hypothetical protein
MEVEGWNGIPQGNDLINTLASCHQIRQGTLDRQHHPAPQRLHSRGIPYEHQGIAESLFVIHQERLTHEGFAVPPEMVWTGLRRIGNGHQ